MVFVWIFQKSVRILGLCNLGVSEVVYVSQTLFQWKLTVDTSANQNHSDTTGKSVDDILIKTVIRLKVIFQLYEI